MRSGRPISEKTVEPSSGSGEALRPEANWCKSGWCSRVFKVYRRRVQRWFLWVPINWLAEKRLASEQGLCRLWG